MKDTITLQQKVKVLNKLFDAKCRTEKDLQGLSTAIYSFVVIRAIVRTSFVSTHNTTKAA